MEPAGCKVPPFFTKVIKSFNMGPSCSLYKIQSFRNSNECAVTRGQLQIIIRRSLVLWEILKACTHCRFRAWGVVCGSPITLCSSVFACSWAFQYCYLTYTFLPILPNAAAAAAKLLQSCLTLCNPIDGSPPGSPIPRILQARTLSGLPSPSPMHES